MYCLFLSFYIFFVCKCVLYCCHRVTTQLQLTNISYHIHQSYNQLLCLVFYLKKGHFLPRSSHESFIDLHHMNIHLTPSISSRFTTLRHARYNFDVGFQNSSETLRCMHHWFNTKVNWILPMHYFHMCHIIITKRKIIFITVLTDCNL